MQRILVAPLRFIGDGILTVPVLRALRQHHPDAHIDLLLPKHLVNLFERCPYVNDLLVDSGSAMSLVQQLKPRHYDLALVLRRSVTQATLFKLAGIKTLIGFDAQRFPPPLYYQRWGWFLDHTVPFPAVDTTTPHVKTMLSVLSPLNITGADESLELWADEADKHHIATLIEQFQLDTKKPLAVFHGTSASREKAMTRQQFIPSLQVLYQHDYEIITLGTDSDREFYDLLSLEAKVPLQNWCGKTTLRQSYALLLQTQLLFSLDSAPIHMAAAAGTPHIVGIYGPTNEHQWRPYPYQGEFSAITNTALSCRPCVPKVCSHNRCRVDLTPETLAAALTPHLKPVPNMVP